jgi:hypothetical protein
VLKFILTGLAGTFLGLAATQTLLDERLSFAGIEIGPWRVAPKTGSAEVDPYSRAQFARTGEIAIAHAEGLSFLALTDSDGARLASRCTYELRGPMPDNRYWTLTLVSPNGLLTENAAGRYGFTSTEVLRAADGSFAITVGRGARAGNWLPAPQSETFDLVLRLYDTLLDFSTSKVDQGALPRIAKVTCE